MTNAANNVDKPSESAASSRLIIKNLPSRVTAERLRNVCSELGSVTDCQLKYSNSGKFRGFAFVGYRTLDEAASAKDYLHNTYIDSARIQVEYCQRLDDKSAHRKKLSKNDSTIVKTEQSTTNGKQLRVLFENLPRGIKKKTFRNFITPIKPVRIDISTTAAPHGSDSAILKAAKKSDANLLLKFHGRFFGGNKISVKLVDEEREASSAGADSTVKMPLDMDAVKRQTSLIAETGRLFVRNIAYLCDLNDLRNAFERFGPLADVKMPLDSSSKQHKGYAMLSYVLPEHALRAYADMDGSVFHGRMLHVIAGEESREEKKAQEESRRIAESSSFKAKKNLKQSTTAGSSHNWNSLFLAPNAVADVLVEKLETQKSELLDAKTKASLGVRMALGETQLVKETRDFLEQNGVYLDSFTATKGAKRSATVILVKNLPSKTTGDELRLVFSKFGELGRLILPPSGISALVEFMHELEAKTAFKALAYKKFKNAPLFLEWAPDNVFAASVSSSGVENAHKTTRETEEQGKSDSMKGEIEETNEKVEVELTDIADSFEQGAVLFVKNLNFQTADDQLFNHFCRLGPLNYATVAKKKSLQSDELLSMGYGFVEFKRRSDALNAIKTLQHKPLDDFPLELKLSDRPTISAVDSKSNDNRRKGQSSEPTQRSESFANSASKTKLLIRNVPFQASRRELENLFKTFGELRSVRLPKKSASSNQHRGFAFIDFCSDSSAKKAFDALKLSTHLYGRRLVLEWAADDENLEELRVKVAEFNSKSGEGGGLANKRRKIMLKNMDE